MVLRSEIVLRSKVCLSQGCLRWDNAAARASAVGAVELFWVMQDGLVARSRPVWQHLRAGCRRFPMPQNSTPKLRELAFSE